MTDMLTTIIPKSDQLNADDLIGGQTKNIKITKVSLLAGEQPVSLNYEGDNGKPYKPCKSMRRVLVNVWGGDGNSYVGRSLTLYRDEKVKFGGADVGGIRISHMSDITKPMTMALTASKALRKPFTVEPLKTGNTDVSGIDDYLEDIRTVPTLEGLQHKFAEAQRAFKADPRMPDIIAAKDKRKLELTQVSHD